MSFENLFFWLLLIPVFALYWVLPQRLKNSWLLVISYGFYALWDYRFLVLLIVSTLTDYLAGFLCAGDVKERWRKAGVALSLFVNLGLLGLFKYFDFFIESFRDRFMSEGSWGSAILIDFGIPIGISFYTFQTISYTLDVYSKRIKPCRDLIDFGLYVAFFPQLVAGPIERARKLLPQIQRAKTWNLRDFELGVYLILGGLFKKMVIADALAQPINFYLETSPVSSLLTLTSGMLAVFLVYFDFSAYSDIARGVAKLFGVQLMINFRPFYFSRNALEFWKRWHISLTTWIRDYVFLNWRSSNQDSRYVQYCKIVVVMSLVGLWHDADWRWLTFGWFHAFAIILSMEWRYQRFNVPKALRLIPSVVGMVSFYTITGLLHLRYYYPREILDFQFLGLNQAFIEWWRLVYYLAPLFLPTILYEYFQHRRGYDFILGSSWPLKSLYCSWTLAGILFFERSTSHGFIYYDF